jgi:hypothetical protein
MQRTSLLSRGENTIEASSSVDPQASAVKESQLLQEFNRFVLQYRTHMETT